MRARWVARRELAPLGTMSEHEYVGGDLPESTDAIVSGLPA